jgi:cytosine/adenosine deaminase-related metal-dependent hydrolase
VAPARWLGVLDDRGTIEIGKRANLVLLNADPLADIRNTRDIDSVFVNGDRFDRGRLDQCLRDLESLYAPFYPYFSPAGSEAIAREQHPPVS